MKLFSLRTSNPEFLARMLAYRRVDRGTRWLNRHAPLNWWRGLFDPSVNGTSHFRAHDAYDNENVLALAFESRGDLANQYGYVTFASVLRNFKIPAFRETIPLENRFPALHGFCADFRINDLVDERLGRPLKKRVRVTSEMLDEAWENRLRDFRNISRIPFRHYSAYERALDERANQTLRHITRDRGFLNWLRGIGKRAHA